MARDAKRLRGRVVDRSADQRVRKRIGEGRSACFAHDTAIEQRAERVEDFVFRTADHTCRRIDGKRAAARRRGLRQRTSALVERAIARENRFAYRAYRDALARKLPAFFESSQQLI